VAVKDGEDKLNVTSIPSKWRQHCVPSSHIKVGNKNNFQYNKMPSYKNGKIKKE
jgi:hypothetical protein